MTSNNLFYAQLEGIKDCIKPNLHYAEKVERLNFFLCFVGSLHVELIRKHKGKVESLDFFRLVEIRLKGEAFMKLSNRVNRHFLVTIKPRSSYSGILTHPPKPCVKCCFRCECSWPQNGSKCPGKGQRCNNCLKYNLLVCAIQKGRIPISSMQ